MYPVYSVRHVPGCTGVGPILLAQEFLERGAWRDPEPLASDRLRSTMLVTHSASLKRVAEGGG